MQNLFLHQINRSSEFVAQKLQTIEYLGFNNFLFMIVAMTGIILIQAFFPPGTRTISRRTWVENLQNWFNSLSMMPWIGSLIAPKYLKEYRCPSCQKLLAKGNLKHKDDVLEVKCRGCSTICLFKGEDAEIIEKRSELLKEGLIPDTELQ